tara:strand:- start:2184 stop:2405 length:222 start_codon:yes stop_codon:yes gene_type:complete
MQYECLREIFFRAFDKQRSETMPVVVGLIPVCEAKHGTTGLMGSARLARFLTGNMRTGHNLRVVRRNQGGKNE